MPSAAIDRLDPATGRSTAAGALRDSRANGVATPLADGRVLLTGNQDPPDWRLAKPVDLRTAQSGVAGSPSVPRLEHAAVLLPDGRVLVIGGFSSAASSVFAELFDPRTETFTPLAAVQPPRGYHAATVQGDGRVRVAGGKTLGADGIEVVPLAGVLRLDPARGAFERLPDLLAPRTQVRAVLTRRGEVLMFGGQQHAGDNSASAELCDPARGDHSVTRLASGRIAVVGGDRDGLQFAASGQIYE